MLSRSISSAVFVLNIKLPRNCCPLWNVITPPVLKVLPSKGISGPSHVILPKASTKTHTSCSPQKEMGSSSISFLVYGITYLFVSKTASTACSRAACSRPSSLLDFACKIRQRNMPYPTPFCKFSNPANSDAGIFTASPTSPPPQSCPHSTPAQSTTPPAGFLHRVAAGQRLLRHVFPTKSAR